MGLFDFVRDIGHKLFGKEDDASQKIEEHIKANNPGIKDLKVDYKDGTAVLSGTAESAEAMQKAVLMAGNVQGVGEVKIEGLAVPVATVKVEYYIIQKGDTLSKIAKYYYSDANAYTKIFEANREVIKDPNLIFPGQKVRIPL